MSYIVPDGYIPIAEEIDSVGREFFSDAWTGTERQTRPLLPPDEQKRILEMQPFKGSGAPGSPPGPANTSFYRKERPLPPPDSSEYKEEFDAHQRWDSVLLETCRRLESGVRQASILDPFNGELHRVGRALWRRHDARQILVKGRARISYSNSEGELFTLSKPAGQRTPPRVRTQSQISYKSGLAGRPTCIQLVEAEFGRRTEQGIALRRSSKKEAEDLRDWLLKKHPDAPQLKTKTIMNHLPKFRRRVPKPVPKQ